MADRGAANERTALAWQRTALSVLAGCAAMARVTWDALAVAALLLLGAGAALSLAVFLLSSSRYEAHLVRRSDHSPRGGGMAFALAAAVVLMGLTQLTVEVTGRLTLGG